MTVKFKGNTEPCIQYRVINPIPIIDYCNVLGKWCEQIEIEALGLVAAECLEEVEGHEGNVNAVDVLIKVKQYGKDRKRV